MKEIIKFRIFFQKLRIIGLVCFFILLMLNKPKAQEVILLDSVNLTNTSGIENVLAGQIAGLQIKRWSGTSGLQSDINLYGLNMEQLGWNSNPLIMINGMPIISSSSSITANNPLSNFSIDQIEKIEIYKDASQLTGFGILAPNGAINLVIKEGEEGPLHVRAKLSTGMDYVTSLNVNTDKFYNYNTDVRKNVYSSPTLLQEQNLLIDGGGNFGSYFFGINNYKSKGGIKNSGFSRQNLFLNAKYNISDPFTLIFYGNISLLNRKGSYNGQYNPSLKEIYDESFFMDENENIGYISTVNLNYRLSSKLKFHSLAGISYETAGRNLYIPSNILNGDVIAGSFGAKRQYLNINSAFDYEHFFSELFKVDLTLGHQLFNSDFVNTSVDGKKSLESGGSDFVKVVTGFNANQTNAFSDRDKEKLISFYGKLKWNFQERILIDLIARTDGSSLYRKKWNFYPAFLFTYNFNIPLSVKTSYGKTGMRLDSELYRGELEALGEYYSGNILGIRQLYLPFENARNANVNNFDFDISTHFINIFNFQIGYHNKTFSQLTYERFLPNINGLNYEYEANMEMGISGIDFTTKVSWIQEENFSWLTNFNLSANNIKLKKLPENIEETGLKILMPLKEGNNLNSLIGYKNGERVIIKKGNTEIFGGLNNYFYWKKISLGMSWIYFFGGNILAESFSSNYVADTYSEQFPLKNGELPYYFVDDIGSGKFIFSGISSIEKTSFARLNNLTFTYDIGNYFERLGVKDVNIIFRAENILTISKYPGINPDENRLNVRALDLKNTGAALPSSFVLGLNLTL